MVQGTGRNNGSKGRLLAGWWKGILGLMAVLGLLIGIMRAQLPEDVVWFIPILEPNSVAFSPDGQFLASPIRFNRVGIFRVSDGSLVRTLHGHTDYVRSVTFSPDGSLIASGSADDTIKIWRVSDGYLIRTLTGHTGDVLSVSFSPDSSLIASGSNDDTIKIWNVTDGSLVRTLTGHTGDMLSVSFSPDGGLIASGSVDDTIKIWRVSTGSLVRTLAGYADVLSVTFSPDGSLIASGSDDSTIKIWRVSDGYLIRTSPEHTDNVNSVSFSPDGSLTASGGGDRTIKIWNVSDGSLVRTLTGHTGDVLSVSFSPDGSLIASGSDDSTIKIWRVSDGSLVRTLTVFPYYVTSVTFSPNGNLIASGSNDKIIRIWRVSDGSLVRTLTGHTHFVNSVTFSLDSSLIASGSLDKTIKIWRVSDGSLVRTLEHGIWVYSVSFSPDGNLIASGGYDGTIKIWRVSDGSLVRILTGHTGSVSSVTFSPDGSLIASGSNDKIIRIWRVSDGSLAGTMVGHTGGVSSVSFSPDGSLLASGGSDGLVLWRVGISLTNYPPLIPILLSPYDGAAVSPTPTFKMKSEDPDGDDVKFEIEVTKGSEKKTFVTDFVSSGSEATFTVPSDQALSEGQWNWRAKATDNKGAKSGWSSSWTFTVQVPKPDLVPKDLTLSASEVEAGGKVTVSFKVLNQGQERANQSKTDVRLSSSPDRPSNDDPLLVSFDTPALDPNQFETHEAEVTIPAETKAGDYYVWVIVDVDKSVGQSDETNDQIKETLKVKAANLLPSIPVLLSPADNAVVSVTPTFKVKSQDPDGDNVKFEIEVTKGSERKTFTTGFVSSGSEATFTVPSDQALSEGQWSWKAKAIDSKGAASDWSEIRTIQVIIVPLIRSGVRLVSYPVTGPTDPKSVFAFDDDKWAWYDPTSGYLLHPNSQTNLQVGKGYWAKFVQDTKPNVEGNLPDATQTFSITLKKGWNLIGNPWLVDLVWDLSSIRVKIGGQEKALKDLGENEGVEPYAWRWNGSNYRLVFDRTIITGVDYTLPSWEGAWVYAHTDCELVLPPPSQSKGRGTRDRGQVVKGNGWSVRLQASVNGSVGEAVMGIANGTRGLAIGLPPEPPTGSSGVQVILLKNNTPLAVDVRSDGSRRQEWEVLVRFGARDGGRGTSERKEVTLTFDGIGYAPKDVSAWLVDTVTGKRLYLRTQPSYRFVAQEGEFERRFKLIVERGNERPLRVVGLKATPKRGQGVVIEFSLTKPAKVEAEVLTLTGRKVAVLDVGSSEGLTHRMVWRGVGVEGQKVGSGVYLVRVKAVDEEGRAVQATTVVRLR